MDAREACFGPCVVAAAYAAVVDTARYTGMRWLICTCRRVLGGDRGLLWASPDYNFPSGRRGCCMGAAEGKGVGVAEPQRATAQGTPQGCSRGRHLPCASDRSLCLSFSSSSSVQFINGWYGTLLATFDARGHFVWTFGYGMAWYGRGL